MVCIPNDKGTKVGPDITRLGKSKIKERVVVNGDSPPHMTVTKSLFTYKINPLLLLNLSRPILVFINYPFGSVDMWGEVYFIDFQFSINFNMIEKNFKLIYDPKLIEVN